LSMRTYKQVRDRVVLCKYEELVTAPEKLMQRIFEFCELKYSDEYLQGLSVINSSHKVESTGISAHGIEKWKTDLNAFERFWFTLLKQLFKYDSL